MLERWHPPEQSAEEDILPTEDATRGTRPKRSLAAALAGRRRHASS